MDFPSRRCQDDAVKYALALGLLLFLSIPLLAQSIGDDDVYDSWYEETYGQDPDDPTGLMQDDPVYDSEYELEFGQDPDDPTGEMKDDPVYDESVAADDQEAGDVIPFSRKNTPWYYSARYGTEVQTRYWIDFDHGIHLFTWDGFRILSGTAPPGW